MSSGGMGKSESKVCLYFFSFSSVRSLVNKFILQFSLAADPASWGTAYTIDSVEPDDALHMPDPRRDKTVDHGGTICTARGLANVGCLVC